MHTPTPQLSEVSYGIDSGDRLEFIDEAWYGFARNNGGNELASESILGKSLWDFISDPETRHLFEMLVKKVRRSEKSLTIPFRCDSPDLRRFLRLKVSPADGGGIRFVSKTLREEKRRAIPLLNGHGEPLSAWLIICSWCKRVEVPCGWVEAEYAIALLGLFDKTEMPQLSHSICPDCRQMVETQL